METTRRFQVRAPLDCLFDFVLEALAEILLDAMVDTLVESLSDAVVEPLVEALLDALFELYSIYHLSKALVEAHSDVWFKALHYLVNNNEIFQTTSGKIPAFEQFQ